MFLPEKLLEKAFYWGPLFIGVISLVGGVILVRSISSQQTQDLAVNSSVEKSQIIGKNKDRFDLANKTTGKAIRPSNMVKLTQKAVRVEKTDHTDKTPRLKSPAKTAIDKSKLITLPKSKPLVKKSGKPYTVKITSSQLASLNGLSIGKMAGTTFSGFNYGMINSKKLGLSHSTSDIAYSGRFSEFGVRKAHRRTAMVLVMPGAHQLGIQGQAFSRGFDIFLNRQTRRLLTHYSGFIGTKARDGMAGVELSGLAGMRVVSQHLRKLSADFGSYPLFVRTGMATSLDGAGRIDRRNKSRHAGVKFAHSAVKLGFKGLARSVIKAETIKAKAVATALPKGADILSDRKGSHKRLSCSDKFYASLQQVQTNKIASLRLVTRPISVFDKTLPGKWIFNRTTRRRARVCARYKTYKSGYRKCKKWKMRPATTQLNYTSEEKKLISEAHLLVIGKGRHPKVKPRTPSYWVINRIATDLNRYSLQQPHPAICTGAIGMMDYFEGNLSRFKKHMNAIAELATLSQSHILSQIDELNSALYAQNITINEEQEDLNTIDYKRIDITDDNLMTILSQAYSSQFGDDFGTEIRGQGDILNGLRVAKRQLTAHRKDMKSRVFSAYSRLSGLIEASYYIRRTNNKYHKLSEHLFGSLADIRTAHNAHCNCPD